MTSLLLLLLFAIAGVYGVFFLFFKIVWLLCKKHTNKWPLILAGLSTVLSGILLAMFTWWGVRQIIKPFVPLQQRIIQNPQPRYGIRTYTDPQYAFTLQVPDGMDYSDWISFKGASIKLGINTNLFKKNEVGKNIEGPILFSMLIRQTQKIDAQHPFAALEQVENKIFQTRRSDIRLDIQQKSSFTVDGYPAYYMRGQLLSDKGPAVPIYMQGLYQPGTVIYVHALDMSTHDATSSQAAKDLVSSLRPILPPSPADN